MILHRIKTWFEPDIVNYTLSYIILVMVTIDLFVLCIIYENYEVITSFIVGIVFYTTYKHVTNNLKRRRMPVILNIETDLNNTIILSNNK